MPRTVAALYDTRAEAESARARLIGEARAKSPRIIGRDTAGAIDSLKIAPADAEAYRKCVRRGGYLVVSEVPTDTSPKRIIELLKQAAGERVGDKVEGAWGDGEQGVRVRLPDDDRDEAPVERSNEIEAHNDADQGAAATERPSTLEVAEPPVEATVDDKKHTGHSAPPANEELRTAERKFARGGARIRTLSREAPAEEQVSLETQLIEVERRPCGRHLSDTEVEAAGLFKERVFEVSEMAEEAVVTKVAVVREEVIVTKTIKERTETVRDTVRRTEIEVEDLAP